MATQTSLSTVQSLYVAYYGRPADPAGLSYWAQRLEDNGGDTTAIIKAFGDSAEYVDRFSGSDSATLVNNLYQQLFGRDAEDTGRDFYVNMLKSGEKSLAEIALTISNAAQGSDSEVFAGRVEVADAFTKELDTAEEIAAYSTERGIGIGKNYLEEVTVTNTATKVLSKTIETVATLLPTTPGDGGTGGGGGTPAPTFTLAVDDSGVLTFGGTATGEISVSADLSTDNLNFTRGGVTATLTQVESQEVQSVDVGAADICVPASLLSTLNLDVKGSGNLTITDVANGIDLAGLSVDNALNVTLEVTESRDITVLDSSWVDNLDLAAGTVVTMTVAQYNDIARSGDGGYALEDTADNLAPSGSVQVPGPVVDGIDVTVTDAVSLTQLPALDSANGAGGLTYTTVSGTAAELQEDVATNGGTGTYVTDGKDVLVTDPIDVAGLDALVGSIGSGTITAQNLEDTAANLVTDSSGELTVSDYVGAGTNVTIIDDETDATIAQVQAIDEQNGDGELTYSLRDDFDAILADLNDDSYDYLTDADGIQVTDSSNLGDRSIADIQKLLVLDDAKSIKDMNGGELSLTSLGFNLVDTPANLAAAAGSDTMDDILLQAGTVTASEAASVSQAEAIYDKVSTASYDITDSAYSLANGDSAAILQAVDVTATTTATATQANIIAGLDGSAGELTYNVADTYANLKASTGVNDATDVTVNWGGSYLTTTQAGEIVAFINGGLTTIPYIRDNAANINGFVSGNGEGEKLRYDFYVEDTAANIITQIGDASADNLYFAKGNADIGVEGDQSVAQIYVTDTFTVDQSETFWGAINPVFDNNIETTAGKTYYRIYDAIENYDDDTVAQDWITKSDQLGVSGSAADIYAAQNGSTAGFDDIFALMNSRGSDYLYVTGSAGSQTIQGAPGSDYIRVGADNDWVDGKAGNDTIYGDAGYDQLYGGDGYDTIYGGDDSDVDYLYGGSGRDTIYAADAAANTVYETARYYIANQITGGEGGDNMYGSTYFDTFYYAGSDRNSLISESGTTQSTRDYITNFGLGDRIVFSEADSVQYFGSGSANASAVDPGTLGLSIRYEKDVQVLNWNGDALTDATRILVDIADQDGQFDDVADIQVILVGSNIDVNWDQNAILYGG